MPPEQSYLWNPSQMPCHSHNHADNSFSSLYSLNWLRNRGLSIEFTIPALLLGELNQPGRQPGPVWSNGLPHTFPPGMLTSSHPIPGRPAGRVPLDCSLYGGKGELLCSEDKLLLQRDGASHVRIMTLNTFAPLSKAVVLNMWSSDRQCHHCLKTR